MSNTPPFDRLTRAQRVALISFLSADRPQRTAALARVTERSIRRWRKQPVFQEALAEARRDFFAACRSHLNTSLAVAFQTLVKTADGASTDGDRLKAALSLLDRIAHTEMSAKPLQEGPQPIEINRLDPEPSGPMRTSADISGPQRTSTAAKRTLADIGGHKRPAWPPATPNS